MARPTGKWPKEKEAELRRRFNAGETYLSISLEMDVTYDSLLRELRRLNLSRPMKRPRAFNPPRLSGEKEA